MKVLIIVIGLIVGITVANGETGFTGQGVRGSLDPNILVISGHVLLMPIGRIVLVRKDSQYCAIKFTEEWEEETDHDNFTRYESYYQGDGSGDFSRGNVQFSKALLVRRKYIPHNPIFPRYGYPAGPENKQIKCGPIKLAWSDWGNVYFNDRTWKSGDHGIELAPTKWTDISQVNVFDPRLKWYRYDEKRNKTFIPIDELWDEKVGPDK